MAPIHRQFIPEPESRAASQRKQLLVSPYGSLCASQRGLHTCQDVAECLEVDDCGWEIIGDFKLASFRMGLQRGFMKFLCFLCLKYHENMMGDYIWELI